jgi:hypothetical protein
MRYLFLTYYTQAIVIIRNGAANIPLIADQEMILSATRIELGQIA